MTSGNSPLLHTTFTQWWVFASNRLTCHKFPEICSQPAIQPTSQPVFRSRHKSSKSKKKKTEMISLFSKCIYAVRQKCVCFCVCGVCIRTIHTARLSRYTIETAFHVHIKWYIRFDIHEWFKAYIYRIRTKQKITETKIAAAKEEPEKVLGYSDGGDEGRQEKRRWRRKKSRRRRQVTLEAYCRRDILYTNTHSTRLDSIYGSIHI